MMPTPPNHFTAAHRAIIERFRTGDKPLCRAIDAVLTELDSRPAGGSARRLIRNLVREASEKEQED